MDFQWIIWMGLFSTSWRMSMKHTDNKILLIWEQSTHSYGMYLCIIITILSVYVYLAIVFFYWGMWDYLPVPAQWLQTLNEKTHHKINILYFKHAFTKGCLMTSVEISVQCRYKQGLKYHARTLCCLKMWFLDLSIFLTNLSFLFPKILPV